MRSNYKPFRELFVEVKTRNTELRVEKLLGINIDKFFMPSVANTVGTDLTKYKIVRSNQFACNRMHVGRDYRIPIALSQFEDEFMVSPAYDVFEVKDSSTLMPEYAMLWFKRREFDRNAWFYTDADVRGGLPWKSFIEMQLPVPPIEKQRQIVAEYNAIENRIRLNEQLIQKLEETAQAVYREWFVDGIDKENLPEGWRVGRVADLCEYSSQRIFINELNLYNYISTENMLQNRGGVIQANNLPAAGGVTKFEIGNILISNIRPYFKKIWLAIFNGGCSNDVLSFVPNENVPSLYLYQILEKDNFFDYVMAGSKGTKMPRGDKKWIMNFETLIPRDDLLEKFSRTTQVFQGVIQMKKSANQKLSALKAMLLSRMATVA